MKKKMLMVIVAVLAASLMFGSQFCFSADSIKIAGLFALTGKAAHIGKSQRNAVILAIDEVNAQGGINGQKLELVEADTESDPTKARIALLKVLESKNIVAIIGPTRTPTGFAIREVVEAEKIPTFMHAGSDAVITVPLKSTKKPPVWSFKSPYRASDALSKICEFMKKQGIKKIGFIYSNDGFGKDGLKNIHKVAPKYGITIVAEEAFGIKDVDMTTQLTSLKAKKPQGIIAWTIGPAMGIVAKNVKQLEIKEPLFECHGAGDPIFWKVAREAGEGVMMPSAKIIVADQLPDSDIQKKKIQDYVKAYKEKFNREPGTMVAYGADAAFLVIDAIKRVGPDRAKIRDAIENTKGYVGISGIYNITSEDHNGLTLNDISIVKATKGGWELID